VQGPEAISVRQALERFVKNYDPSLKIRVAPLWVMRMIGLFNPKMKFVAHLFAYFGDHEDPFYAKETWEKLGEPTTTLEVFAGSFGKVGICSRASNERNRNDRKRRKSDEHIEMSGRGANRAGRPDCGFQSL